MVKGSDRRISVRGGREPSAACRPRSSSPPPPTSDQSYSFAAISWSAGEPRPADRRGAGDPGARLGKVIHRSRGRGQIEEASSRASGIRSPRITSSIHQRRSLNAASSTTRCRCRGYRRSAPLLESAPDRRPLRGERRGEDPILPSARDCQCGVQAIGVRFRHYPITPEDVLKGLKEKRVERGTGNHHHGFLGAGRPRCSTTFSRRSTAIASP